MATKKSKTSKAAKVAPRNKVVSKTTSPQGLTGLEITLTLIVVLVAILAFVLGALAMGIGYVPNSTAAAVAPATSAPVVIDPRIQHLLDLDKVYRSQGWEGWLRTAGIQFDSAKVESRQPVEEVIMSHITVTSLVIRATDMVVNWPACITTDRPNEVKTSSETRQYQPDLTNPSVLYTNATLNGQGTVYADCSDWGQLDPTK